MQIWKHLWGPSQFSLFTLLVSLHIWLLSVIFFSIVHAYLFHLQSVELTNEAVEFLKRIFFTYDIDGVCLSHLCFRFVKLDHCVICIH